MEREEMSAMLSDSVCGALLGKALENEYTFQLQEGQNTRRGTRMQRARRTEQLSQRLGAPSRRQPGHINSGLKNGPSWDVAVEKEQGRKATFIADLASLK